jgi:putative two-component system response regulator
VYKPPYSHLDAVRVIRERAASDFDPDVVDAFLTVEGRLRDIALKFVDSEEQRSALLLASGVECVA